jgi:hypothetical protein
MRPDALGLEILRQVHVLVVRPQGSAHEADSAALQLLHNHLLLSGAKILKAVHVDPDGALRPQCEARSPCQA